MSMCCFDCHDYMDGFNRGKKEGTIEKLENIKEKIDLEEVDCQYETDYVYNSGLQKAIEIIDKEISELKGMANE